MNINKLRKNDYLIILVSIYAVTSVVMNIFANKALSFGTPIIIMDGGLLISWLAFAIPNIILEVYGKNLAKFVSYVVATISFTIFIIGYIITKIPTLPSYSEQSMHFAYIFDNGIRVIISSSIAFILSGLINIHIIDILKSKIKNDNAIKFFKRAFVSSVVGQFVDNFLFQFLAFAPIGFSLYEMKFIDIWTAVISSTIVEVAIESIFIIPFTRNITLKLSKINDN